MSQPGCQLKLLGVGILRQLGPNTLFLDSVLLRTLHISVRAGHLFYGFCHNAITLIICRSVLDNILGVKVRLFLTQCNDNSQTLATFGNVTVGRLILVLFCHRPSFASTGRFSSSLEASCSFSGCEGCFGANQMAKQRAVCHVIGITEPRASSESEHRIHMYTL